MVATIAYLLVAIRTQLAQGALTGFHDTIMLVVLLSLVGFCLALLLRDTPTMQPALQGAPTTNEQTIESVAVELGI